MRKIFLALSIIVSCLFAANVAVEKLDGFGVYQDLAREKIFAQSEVFLTQLVQKNIIADQAQVQLRYWAVRSLETKILAKILLSDGRAYSAEYTADMSLDNLLKIVYLQLENQMLQSANDLKSETAEVLSATSNIEDLGSDENAAEDLSSSEGDRLYAAEYRDLVTPWDFQWNLQFLGLNRPYFEGQSYKANMRASYTMSPQTSFFGNFYLSNYHQRIYIPFSNSALNFSIDTSQIKFSTKELYFKHYLNDQLSLSLGKQVVVWGAGGINLLDIVSPMDFYNLDALGQAEKKDGLLMSKVNYSLNEVHSLEFVYVPYYQMSESIQTLLTSLGGDMDMFDLPPRDNSSAQYAFRYSIKELEYDLGFYFYDGYNFIPYPEVKNATIVREGFTDAVYYSVSNEEIKLSFKPMRVFGTSFSRSLGAMILRGELMYSDNFYYPYADKYLEDEYGDQDGDGNFDNVDRTMLFIQGADQFFPAKITQFDIGFEAKAFDDFLTYSFSWIHGQFLDFDRLKDDGKVPNAASSSYDLPGLGLEMAFLEKKWRMGLNLSAPVGIISYMANLYNIIYINDNLGATIGVVGSTAASSLGVLSSDDWDKIREITDRYDTELKYKMEAYVIYWGFRYSL